MSIFKCKMCGGELQINPGESVAVCEYCGTTQTLPKLDDDRRANLYDRANHFRRNNDFDKAAGIYEQILNEDKTDAEAYWSLVLCRYGIEYVEDPATHKRVPTVNRAQYTSIFDDEDYKAAIQYADAAQRVVYEAEAKAINEIQKGILEISQKEEPFDVFICYKETDANGRRTPDSVLATDLYHQLTQEGFKVFFSRITLEDKLGTAYEPYIFAALNSAKVMVVLGTKPEYFNAVWVKNEWSRYLALIRGGAKKVLIPAYRDMDPYDLPEEFSHLQAQDMSKLGFMQDLIRGIKKLTEADKPAAKETVVVQESAASTAPLLERAFMFLEDGNWHDADQYCEKVLDQDPKCAQAYLGKLMAELRVRKQAQLADCDEPFDDRDNFRKVIRFGDETLCTTLEGYITHIRKRNEEARLSSLYTAARQYMNAAQSETDYRQAAKRFAEIPNYRDADGLRRQCLEQAEICHKDAIYSGAAAIAAQENPDTLREAAKSLTEIPGWRDADQLRAEYLKRADELEAEAQRRAEEERLAAEKRAEEERLAAERKVREDAARKRRNKKLTVIGSVAAVIIIAVFLLVTKVILPSNQYHKAVALMNEENYTAAIAMFEGLNGYKESEAQITECNYNYAVELYDAGQYQEAIAIFEGLNGYKESEAQLTECNYDYAVELYDAGQYQEAALAFGSLGDYKDARERCMPLFQSFSNIIATGMLHTIALKVDGTVVATGYNECGQCDVSDWADITAIIAGDYHTVGLKADGTVVATGLNRYDQCDVSDWTDIVAIAAGQYHTVGLKANGTVVATGRNEYGECDVSDWTDIVAVSAGELHTVGLKADGSVIATGYNKYGECDISDWSDIVAIAAGNCYTVGLKADGTVVATGYNTYGACDVSDWTDIVAIAAENHTVGLKADGTVVATGKNEYGACDVSDWTDIVAIAAGQYHTVGLKADGTVVATGSNRYDQCDVSDWTGIGMPTQTR